MPSRSDHLRRRHRKILWWSLGVAAAAHVAVFALSPDFETQPLVEADEDRGGPTRWTREPRVIEVLFGPPTIRAADGSLWTEPAERVLRTERVTQFPAGCEALGSEEAHPLQVGLRLRVSESGHATVLGVAESTGNACGDAVLAVVASSLRYHWLPNERFEAPVELTQPVTLAAVWE